MHIIENAKLKDARLTCSNSQLLLGSKQALPLLHLESTACDAIISLQGAQLLQFTPKHSKPWLYLDNKNSFTAGDSIIGGIPLCLPWFGHHSNRDWPIHGYAQNNDWQLERIEQEQQSIMLEFSYQHEATEQFPYRFLAKHSLRLGDDIQLSLSLENQSAETLPLSFAWHTYYKLDKSQHCQLNGLQQQFYLDNLQQLQRSQLQGAIAFTDAIDAVFEQAPETQILDTGLHQLHIDGEHCPSCIVWQPSSESPFACVERGFAFADSLQLAPKQYIRCSMHIKETP